ncbi:copper(I)-binding protein [Nakamurella sp. UYEF19]|uniref:hypothetical protein n=1 Tax=Nakamurella sp. UYEF19 TaxID=1756392 RepID=UPI00339AC52A
MAVMAAVLTLTGCAAGQIAQTADQVAAIDGANGTVGVIGVRNALLATPDGTDHAKGSDVALQVWVSNDGVQAETLTGITTPAATAVKISGTATIPGQTLKDFTGTTVKITLTGLTSGITYGESVPITFTFASAGKLTVNVPVEVPDQRTSGRATIDIQPAHEGTLWESGPTGAEGSGAGSSGAVTPSAGG